VSGTERVNMSLRKLPVQRRRQRSFRTHPLTPMPTLCFWSQARICPRKFFVARSPRNFGAHYEKRRQLCGTAFCIRLALGRREASFVHSKATEKTTFPFGGHARKARAGSMRVVRRAGTRHARNATADMIRNAEPNATGSCGLIS
jgi:hypothetical protein